MEKAFSRLDSLDILRGLTIILMIVVNDPGSWSHVYAPLLHAEWNGLTPTDYVFPSFLFIVGVSIVLSISKQRENGVGQTQILKKVAFRALKIYLVGLFLWLWPAFDFERIRWVGVLPRIAVVFLICAIIYLYTQKKTQTLLLIVLLISYWLIMAYLPIPGIGNPDLSVPEKNWANYLDSQFFARLSMAKNLGSRRVFEYHYCRMHRSFRNACWTTNNWKTHPTRKTYKNICSCRKPIDLGRHCPIHNAGQ